MSPSNTEAILYIFFIEALFYIFTAPIWKVFVITVVPRGRGRLNVSLLECLTCTYCELELQPQGSSPTT